MAVRVGVDRWIEADEETSQDVDESAENIGGGYVSLTIHDVWYIYLHEWLFWMVKYGFHM